MGLDMYLNKKTYIGNEYREPEQRIKIIIPENQDKVIFKTGAIKEERISEITERVGYWRKANSIHNWFVENCQEGNDNCQETYVEREKLQELLDLCKKVKEERQLAPELLPTQGGFFFGNVEYNEMYEEDINDTIKILEECLSEEGGDYYYRASW